MGYAASMLREPAVLRTTLVVFLGLTVACAPDDKSTSPAEGTTATTDDTPSGGDDGTGDDGTGDDGTGDDGTGTGDPEPEVGFEVGMVPPDFALPDASGATVRLSDFSGKRILVVGTAEW